MHSQHATFSSLTSSNRRKGRTRAEFVSILGEILHEVEVAAVNISSHAYIQQPIWEAQTLDYSGAKRFII